MNYMPSQSTPDAKMSLSGWKTECLLHSYCGLGAPSTRSRDIAPCKVGAVHLLSEVVDQVEHKERLTHTRQLKASFDLGATIKSADLCSSVFCCQPEENLEPVSGHTSTQVPQCASPGACITCTLEEGPNSGPSTANLEDGELPLGANISLGVGKPPPKPPWGPLGLGVLGTSLRMEESGCLQWHPLPSGGGTELTISSGAGPPPPKLGGCSSAGPQHRTLSSLPMHQKLEPYQDAAVRPNDPMRGAPPALVMAAVRAAHQQLTEPVREVMLTGKFGLPLVGANDQLAGRTPAQASRRGAQPGPCWHSWDPLPQYWPLMHPLDHLPSARGYQLGLSLPTIDRLRREVNPASAQGVGEVPPAATWGGWVVPTGTSPRMLDLEEDPRGETHSEVREAKVATPVASPRMPGLPEAPQGWGEAPA